MTSAPSLSPWLAPTPADAAPNGSGEPTAAKTQRRPADTLVSTARWLGSRSQRLKVAALKEEQRIRADLADLPAGWYVLPRPTRGEPGNEELHVDQVAIGPTGVFIVYFEHHPAARVWVSEHQLTIDGHASKSVQQARAEARCAGDRLTDACGFDVTVQAVLVLIGAATMQTLSRPAEVHVRNQYDLRDWLCKQPERLGSETVRTIYNASGRVEPFKFQAGVRGSSTTTGI